MEAEVPYAEIQKAFNRYIRCDWGDLCEEDKQMNEQAIISGKERILAKYTSKAGKEFYIITEWDRSVTTALLVEEY